VEEVSAYTTPHTKRIDSGIRANGLMVQLNLVNREYQNQRKEGGRSFICNSEMDVGMWVGQVVKECYVRCKQMRGPINVIAKEAERHGCQSKV